MSLIRKPEERQYQTPRGSRSEDLAPVVLPGVVSFFLLLWLGMFNHVRKSLINGGVAPPTSLSGRAAYTEGKKPFSLISNCISPNKQEERGIVPGSIYSPSSFEVVFL